MEQDLLLIGAANKDREGKDREGRKIQGMQKRQTGLFRDVVPRNGRRAVTVQRTSWKYGKPALWIVRYLSVSSLVKRCLCSMERGPYQSRIFSKNHSLCLNRSTAERWNS